MSFKTHINESRRDSYFNDCGFVADIDNIISDLSDKYSKLYVCYDVNKIVRIQRLLTASI